MAENKIGNFEKNSMPYAIRNISNTRLRIHRIKKAPNIELQQFRRFSLIKYYVHFGAEFESIFNENFKCL